MKRILILCSVLGILLSANISRADDERVIQMHQLPENAQNFIKHHFSDLKPILIKQDRDFPDVSYKVVFTNGTKIEFNKRGEWEEINCDDSFVPKEVIPSKIALFIKDHYPNAKVKEIEIDDDNRKYEVELNNGITLKFNRNQELVDIDD